MVAYFPLRGDDNEIIEQSAIFQEDTMTILSAYNVTQHQESVDMLYRYHSVPKFVWIFLVLSFFVVSAVIKLRDIKRMSRSTWLIARAFLNQSSFVSLNTPVNILSITTLISLFFTICYTTTSVGTDLVVIDQPSVLQSYQDIVDNKAIVAFSYLLPEYDEFKKFPENSIEHKLLRNHVTFNFDPDSVFKHRAQLLKQKVVAVGREVMVDSVGYSVLSGLQSEIPKLRILRIQDPRAARYTNSFIWNKKCNIEFQTMVKTLVNRMQAVGILDKVYKSVPESMITFLWGSLFPSIRRKLTKSIEVEKPDFIPIRLHNITHTFVLYFVMIIISIIFLVFEILNTKYLVFKERRSIRRFRNQKRNEWIEVKVVEVEVKIKYLR